MTKFEIFFNKIKANKRYILASLILLVSFIFGKNLNGENNIVPSSNNAPLEYSRLSSSSPQYRYSGQHSFLEGNYYRVIIPVRSDPLVDKFGTILADQVDVSLASSRVNGEKVNLGSKTINADGDMHDLEFLISATTSLEGLTMEKSKILGTPNIDLYEPKIYVLDIDKDEELSDLKNTLVGDARIKPVESTVNQAEAKRIYSFSKKPRTAGQIFKADESRLSAIDFKLSVAGSGGFGDYFIVIKEAKKVDGKFQVLPEKIATFSFRPEGLTAFARSDSIYHFPIPALLKKGQYYYIGISDAAVRINLINHLDIFGSKVDYELPALELKESGKTREIGGLYLKPYYIENQVIGDRRLLSGQVVQDLGNGKGLLSYEFDGSAKNFTDADSYGNQSPENGFNYNFVDRSIDGVAKDNRSLIYKVESIYPFKILSVSVEQIDRAFGCDAAVYYSYDKQSWHKIPRLASQGQPNKFAADIIGKENTTGLYLKFGYDSSDPFVTDKIFSFKNLKISGEVIIK